MGRSLPPSGVWGSEPRKGYLFRRNLNGHMVEFSQRPADSGLPALPPSPWRVAPAQRISGRLKLGFPPTSLPLSPHRHSRPRRCTIGTLLVGGMQLHTGVRTEWGGGRHAQETETPGWGFSRSRIGGLEIWQRDTGHTSSPEFNTFGKRILKARRLGLGGCPFAQGIYPHPPFLRNHPLSGFSFFSLLQREVCP